MKKVQEEQEKPAALVHAEWLGRSVTLGAPEAAAELVRLYEENGLLKEVLKNSNDKDQKPMAWYVKRSAPGRRDHGMKLGPFWKIEDAQEWVDENHTLHEMYDAPPDTPVPTVAEVNVTDEMAYSFHRALSDSSLGANEVEEIKTGLRAALANIPAVAINQQMLEALKHAQKVMEFHNLKSQCLPVNDAIAAADPGKAKISVAKKVNDYGPL